MTIRWKISLLITITGFAASLVFSCFIVRELLEQPFRIMDSDLGTMARRAVHIVYEKEKSAQLDAPFLIGDKRYWLKVWEKDRDKLIYTSDLARLVEIPEPAPGTGITVSLDISRDKIYLGREKERDITFRVRKEKISYNGKTFFVTVGRPMERLEEELRETFVGIIGGLIFSVLLLLGTSYFVAGLILKPVKIIGDQARDISERHLDLRIPVTGRRDEFNALAETLNQVFNRLQRAFMQQRRLIADASHELKTPLTMMRLSVDEMRSQYGEDPSGPQARDIGRMTGQVLRMERLVKNLLDLSSLEIESTIAVKPVNVASVLEALLEDYRFLAETKDIGIKDALAPGLLIHGDEERLNRAFSNIIDNALKYNVYGGWVEVQGDALEEKIRITVTNSGPGVPEDKFQKVFDRFYRVEASRSHRHGGSGLGLAIVKRIIELHEGTVGLESDAGTWTRVVVTLPKKEGKMPA